MKVATVPYPWILNLSPQLKSDQISDLGYLLLIIEPTFALIFNYVSVELLQNQSFLKSNHSDSKFSERSSSGLHAHSEMFL